MTTVTAQQVVDILQTQPLSTTDYRTILDALDSKMDTQSRHASWCANDVFDERLGLVCSSDSHEFASAKAVGSASIDGRPGDYTIAVEVEDLSATGAASHMLILSPQDWRSALAILRAAPAEAADVVEKLLQIAAEGAEVVR